MLKEITSPGNWRKVKALLYIIDNIKIKFYNIKITGNYFTIFFYFCLKTSALFTLKIYNNTK